MIILLQKLLALLNLLGRIWEGYHRAKERAEDAQAIEDARNHGIAGSTGGVSHREPPPDLLDTPANAADD